MQALHVTQDLSKAIMLENGFEIIDDFIAEKDISNILNEIDDFEFSFGTGGIRNAEKKLSSVRNYANSNKLHKKAASYINGKPSFVRAILFNKTATSNWLVSWHQDKTVSVTSKFEKFGWGPWSTKDSIVHVQPPIEVLNEMVTFRIHLDASTKENGCLRVLPKSHAHGVIPQDKISTYVDSTTAVECVANRGSALVMRPHILHASSKGLNPSQRRVLHLEFSSYLLPEGIKWA